jgi:hypothetical protein
MGIASFIAFAVMPKQLPEPVLWLRPNGQITIDGQTVKPRFSDGIRAYRTHLGMTYDLSGRKSGIYFGDPQTLKLTESMTVSLWINPRSYVNDGPGAQILFRGDDRGGVDPYYMAIHGDGTINFSVQDETQRGMRVTAELPLHKWSQITANWDSETGFMKMWLDGVLVGMARTTVKPFANLDRGWTPGVSVGNVQNDKGPHNQPFNGMISDLRLYRGAWTPDELGVGNRFLDPPAQNREMKVD